jgi:hypothetical protein
VSRGSPEPAWQGAEAFGYPVESNDAREKTALFRKAISGAGVVAGDVGGKPGGPLLAVQPQSPGLVDRVYSAVQAADTVLLTVPSQLGVEYNAQTLDTIAREAAPAFGWKPERTVSETASLNLP